MHRYLFLKTTSIFSTNHIPVNILFRKNSTFTNIINPIENRLTSVLFNGIITGLSENNPVHSAIRQKRDHKHKMENHVYLCRKTISGEGHDL